MTIDLDRLEALARDRSLTRESASAIATACAALRSNDHAYLAGAGTPGWRPHEWVIDAMLSVATSPDVVLALIARIRRLEAEVVRAAQAIAEGK